MCPWFIFLPVDISTLKTLWKNIQNIEIKFFESAWNVETMKEMRIIKITAV